MATGMKGRPAVFISHAVSDRAATAAVAAALTDAGFDAWSFNDAFPGENIFLKAGQALEKAEAIVLMISPAVVHLATNRYVLEFALSGDRFAGRVIPVVLQPTPDMPWILAKMDPIAADGRLKQACEEVVERLLRPAEV